MGGARRRCPAGRRPAPRARHRARRHRRLAAAELVGGARGRARRVGGRRDLGPGGADLPRARAGRDHARRGAGLRDRPAGLPGPRPRGHARFGRAGRGARPEATGGGAGRGGRMAQLGRRDAGDASRGTDHRSRRTDDRGLHVGHDVGGQGRGRQHARVPGGADPAPPGDAVHVPRPRLHARAGLAHHRPPDGGHVAAGLRVLRGAARAVGRGARRRRHAELRRDVHRRSDRVHPGAGRRGGGGRARVAAALVRLQPRWERDPARRGRAGRGPRVPAPPRVRDDRVPDGVGVAR